MNDDLIKENLFELLRLRVRYARYFSHKHSDNYAIDLLRALRDESYNWELSEEEKDWIWEEIHEVKRYVSNDNL